MSLKIVYKETCGKEREEIIFTNTADDSNRNIIIFKSSESSRCLRKVTKSFIVSFFKDVFLPQGFPDSVHPDYIPYQIWDTVQAFASTIMGTLTTHSIMKGVGVGDTTATPLAAAITWILKDGTGMIGRIMFAWWSGTELDAQCKKWRLFADALNDIAMGIELVVPYFSSYSTLILCTSTAMKSIVGVAGGATRAALTQHQALKNNLADVSAKDGSQETFVNLIASFVGILILSNVYSTESVVILYLLLVTVHLLANYKAVTSLRLSSLNEDRLSLIIRNYLMYGRIFKPEEINKLESIRLFKEPSKEACGFNIKIGVSLKQLLKLEGLPFETVQLPVGDFTEKKFIYAIDKRSKHIYILLREDAHSCDVLEAYFFCCVKALGIERTNSIRSELEKMNNLLLTDELLNSTTTLFNISKRFIQLLKQSEWITETNLLPVGGYKANWENASKKDE